MPNAIDVPEALYDKLCEVARANRTITYRAIAPQAEVDPGHEFFATLVGHKLDEVNRLEHAAGRRLLSAVVIGEETGMPGSGFFVCARELGVYSGKDDLAFWISELKRVHDYWSRH
jgi:hypothetical protein